jgi:hypothetical protein
MQGECQALGWRRTVSKCTTSALLFIVRDFNTKGILLLCFPTCETLRVVSDSSFNISDVLYPAYKTTYICEFWGFNGSDVSSRGLLGCAQHIRGPRCLWNVGILPQHYTASQPRRPRLEAYLHINFLTFACSRGLYCTEMILHIYIWYIMYLLVIYLAWEYSWCAAKPVENGIWIKRKPILMEKTIFCLCNIDCCIFKLKWNLIIGGNSFFCFLNMNLIHHQWAALLSRAVYNWTSVRLFHCGCLWLTSVQKCISSS